jgi:hypothetical protein
MVLSARYVHRPRYARRCDGCGRRLGPHLYLYGRAHETERPYPLRLCLACCTGNEPKVAAALAVAAERAALVAAEAAALVAWNAGAGCPTPP